MNKDAKIYIAGHTGVVGLAIHKKLTDLGYRNILTKSRRELDLTDQSKVKNFFSTHSPEIVFLAAGQTGGVYANINYPAKFIYENIMMSSNVLHEAFQCGTQKVFYFGCSSMYPKDCPQPMNEADILTGPLEPTNEPFAVAKIAGMMMCDSYNRQYGTSFFTIIPTNLYGEGLDYDPTNSIVIPSLIQRFHTAKKNKDPKIQVWGTGKAKRDFLFSSDLADATLFLAENCMESGVFNVGTGMETNIEDLAKLIAQIVGYDGEIEFDTTKPQGVERKLQNLEKIRNMGWKSQVNLQQGLTLTYKDFLAREHQNRSLS